jgi:peptide methionine sulfoxide reductase MsrA
MPTTISARIATLRTEGGRQGSKRVRTWRSEDYHQQYLDKVPNGYCPIHATGVKLSGPIVQMEQV